MTREAFLTLFATLLLGFGNAAMAQPPKPVLADDEPQRFRGFLPSNWGKIGLSDAQKQEIYKRQAKYKAQIRALEQEIAELKSQERKELYEVLTDAQKDRLREIILEKIGGLEPNSDPKPDDSDSDDDK